MTTNDVAKLLKLNKDMYQHSDRPFTDDTLAVWLTVWTAALKDVPTEAGLMALHRAFTVCRFPVTLAELCAQLRSMQAANCTPVGTMWERILKAAHEAKENMSRYGHTFREPDGQTQGQHARNQNKAIFAALPLVAQEWLGSVRELSTLDTLDTTALNFKRKEFEKIYSKHLDNLPFCPELLTHTATINGHQSAAILDTNETR